MQTYLTQKAVVRLAMLGILAALTLTMFNGCGSTQSSTTQIINTIKPVTAMADEPGGDPTAPGADYPKPAPTPPPASNPVVHFSANSWPFTAQLASIELSSRGTTGSPSVPPPYAYLLVKVNITSLVTGRSVEPPELAVRCHAPGDHSWTLNDTQEGFDEGSSAAPSSSGFNVTLSDGQPHPWDVEWEVRETTSTTDVTCVLFVVAGTEKRPFKLN